MNELARQSQENRELRANATRVDTFDGLTADELVRLLMERPLTQVDARSRGARLISPHVDSLVVFGLLRAESMRTGGTAYFLSETGRRFRNRLLADGVK